MKTNKIKKPPEKEAEIEAEEWDLSEGMGILPEDIPFTQNIGCVGGKTKKPENTNKKLTK
ncbi:hypothetical protein [Algoriphagus aquimarinus]|uniref:Uncharacterized protein n=1 Tax=Algoriphagus aquimarinus TaxID=237018 RepID=A0A1I1BS09_9BACT|nr:hypothetical protein [Algoriphagus aquimarinus]SFB51478.1 hypothetical protein SAMN04489723_11566 [Algoriphagus aquimarinus]|tara:strand:- start:70395 stop:70574 length:180 start_codon:yes stop_codon:yes gene_type:complete